MSKANLAGAWFTLGVACVWGAAAGFVPAAPLILVCGYQCGKLVHQALKEGEDAL